MEEGEEGNYHPRFTAGSAQTAPPPSLVSFSRFSPIPCPSSRRLSSHFTPSRPVASARRLACVSLQGRLVNAEEASSSKAIGEGGLNREQALAWELFSPIQRFLIVAVIGVAAGESKKNRLISQLKKSVELRDQVLSSMQQKLDDLCEQMHNIKSKPGNKNAKVEPPPPPPSHDAFGCDKIRFVDCGCWFCDQHQELLVGLMGNSAVKACREDEVLQYKMPSMNEVEQEERRMSDFSDWASSVASTAEIQMNTFALDQDICNLKRVCEEKDATIKELSTILESANVAGSKRIAELEDVIRRKNMLITKLRKDTVVLEQKVVHLTRLQRPSSKSILSDSWQLPLMVDNVVYDMDGTTSPSSSDSDSSPVNRQQASVVKIQETSVQNSDLASKTNKKSAPAKASSVSSGLTNRYIMSRPVSPLKELSTNEKSIRLSSLRTKQLSGGEDARKIRRRTQTASKDAAPKKRWA